MSSMIRSARPSGATVKRCHEGGAEYPVSKLNMAPVSSAKVARAVKSEMSP